MITRAAKGDKFARWRIVFAKSSQVRSWSNTLDAIVIRGKAKITFQHVSTYVVELVWQHAVTCSCPTKMVRLATEQNASFETIGGPLGIVDDVYIAADEVAAAAPTGVADDARGSQMKLRLLL